MGCQTEIVKLITEHAGYMITLKRIKAHYENVEQLFKSAIRTRFQGIEHACITQENKLTGEKNFAIT